jgi:hypothetical protein
MRWLLLVALALPLPAAAQTIEGTALEHEPDLIHCGRLAVAGWVTFRVDRTVSGRAIAPGTVVRVIVQCPTMIRAGTVYRLELATERPRTDEWNMFSQLRPPPDDGVPTYWAAEQRQLR